MVRAWYMCEAIAGIDQRLPQQRDPPCPVSLEMLKKITGVEYFQINCESYQTDGVLDKIKEERGYIREDDVTCSKECLPNYDETMKSFYGEHLHADEEIRLVLEGSGYFDVRDGEDNWIRIEVVPGEMIVIPSGIYHRFTLDTNNFLRAKRLFSGEPIWLPHYRPVDNMKCRKNYLNKLKAGFV